MTPAGLQWSMANRIAHIAATQAHDELGIDPRILPIETSESIARAGVSLMYRPLPSLFGAYIADPQAPGILINCRLDRAVRRHTAAHELGHHQLRHGTVYDGGADSDDAEPPVVLSRLPDHEKIAEAFAVWFLMPLAGVRAVLGTMVASGGMNAECVYQLALRLGTSYATTARHLVSLQLTRQTDARAWMSIPPGRLKRALAGDLLDSTRGVEVWDLMAGATDRVRATDADLLVLPDGCPVEFEGPAQTAGRSPSGRWVLRCEPVSEPAVIGIDTPQGYAHIRVEPRPHGLYVPPGYREGTTSVGAC